MKDIADTIRGHGAPTPPPGTNEDFWVFGYGSLMWRPGFDYVATAPALLHGFHRALCILSHVYRGTPACPGLVLGLDRGGSCRGRAFKVAAANRGGVLAYLHEREMINDVYLPGWRRLRLPGATVAGYAFVANRASAQYVGSMDLEQTVAHVLQGHGKGGACIDYVRNTVAHLDELSIGDGPLHRVLAAAEAHLLVREGR